VVEDKPILSAEYSFFYFWSKLTHPAVRSLR